MDVIAMLQAFFGFGKAVAENRTQRDAEKNAPDVKQGAIAKQEQQTIDELNNAVAKGDLDAIRKADAE